MVFVDRLKDLTLAFAALRGPVEMGVDVIPSTFAGRHRGCVDISEVAVQELRGRTQLLGPANTMAADEISQIKVRVRAVAGPGTGAVQVLTPQQKFNGVVIGGDVMVSLLGSVRDGGRAYSAAATRFRCPSISDAPLTAKGSPVSLMSSTNSVSMAPSWTIMA